MVLVVEIEVACLAQETGKKYSAELGVTVTHYENMAALASCSVHEPLCSK